jgi:hypothetical protein
MKNLLNYFFAVILITTACSDEEEVVMIDSSLPQGEFSTQRMGSFVDQNNAGSSGTAALGTDSQATSFLRFNEGFNTALGTGTVTVFLSTSETFTPDPGNGNPDLLLLGAVRSAGVNFFKIPENTNTTEFSHVILWCGSAGIPFGYANLQ